MQARQQFQPDALTLAASTWLAAGLVLLGLTPLPMHDPRYGWSLAFWLLAAPSEVVKLALRATAPIGDGLYGVDIKQTADRLVVIEVNDNPSIDAGVEDEQLESELYRRIMQEFLRRMERKRTGAGV